MLVLFIAVALGAGVQTRNGPRFSCIAEPVPGAWSPASEQDIGVYTAPPQPSTKHLPSGSVFALAVPCAPNAVPSATDMATSCLSGSPLRCHPF